MKRNKRKNKFMFLFLLLLAISVGYAALSTTLKINGTTNIKKNSWDVYWANVGDVNKSSTTTVNVPAVVDMNDKTKVDFSVVLDKPGDYYEFTVDAVNAGTIDAMVNITSQTTVPSYVNLSITYADGSEIHQYDLLPQAPNPKADPPVYTKEKIKVRIEFSKDIDESVLEDIGDGKNLDIEIDVPYDQADDNAVDRHALQLGDYIEMIPDAATASTTYAGFSGSTSTGDQILWRVININKDGTIDAVSHYASTNSINITGKDGYKNYAAGLQDIASKYVKSGYTAGTRMMGYDGQTLVIADTSAFDGSKSYYPSTDMTPMPTTGTGEEFGGGVLGDTLYLKDYQLVKSVYGSVSATKKNGSSAAYWIPSRLYLYDTSDYYSFYGLSIDSSGINPYAWLRWYHYDHWGDSQHSRQVRPIITLYSNLTVVNGDGSMQNPYHLSNRRGWVLTNSKTPLSDQKWEYWENGVKINSGWKTLNDLSGNPNTYYFENGYSYHGWLEQGGNKYYLSTFDDDGNGYLDGRRFNGETREIDGVNYTFDANGVCTNCN
jgi:hypothetical protein